MTDTRLRSGKPRPALDGGAAATARIRARLAELAPDTEEVRAVQAALPVVDLPPGWLPVLGRALGLTRPDCIQIGQVVSGKRRIPTSGRVAAIFS
jgi:hypothetical protein